jgi:dihydroorotate dehydrogenase electron transfer subunit
LNRYLRAKIINNLPLNSKTNLLTIDPLEPIINPEPGQFYMIEVGNSYDPLLKRPFSYFRKISEGIQFLYAIKGKGTSLMKDFKQGMIIKIIGPLGTGYPKPKKNYIPLLIAGGIGIASVFSLVEKFSKKAYVIYGAKSKDELLMLNELKTLLNKLVICTDDGSSGEKGTVIDVLNDFLTSHFSLLTSYLLYACGPKPMLEAISKIAIDKGIKGYVSLEENMACGLGACLGCAVKTINGYKRVCKEGPVFPIEEIVWE